MTRHNENGESTGCEMSLPFCTAQQRGSLAIYTDSCPLSVGDNITFPNGLRMPPRSFILKSAKYVLLTYSQSGPLDPQAVLRMLESINATCIIGKEGHADGGTHLHAFVEFQTKFSSRRPDVFDVDGYHPNIEKVGRTPWKAWDYATKENDIVGGTCERPPENGGGDGLGSKWAEIVAAGTRDEFFERLERLDPRSMVCNHPAVTKYADWRYRDLPEPYSHPSDFTFNLEGYNELGEWVQNNVFDEGPTISVRLAPLRTGAGLRPKIASLRSKKLI